MVEAEFKWKHNRDMREAAQRLKDLQNSVGSALEDAMEEIGLRVMAAARRLCPVDTGRLRASISQAVERATEHTIKAIVGSNVVYAPVQEVKQPYLRPAFEQNRKQIRRIIKEALEDAQSSFL